MNYSIKNSLLINYIAFRLKSHRQGGTTLSMRVLSIFEDNDFVRVDVFISPPNNQQQSEEDSADEESPSAKNLFGNQLNSTGEATVYKGNKRSRILSVSDEIGEQSKRFNAIAPPNNGRRTRMKISEAQNICNIVDGKRKTRGRKEAHVVKENPMKSKSRSCKKAAVVKENVQDPYATKQKGVKRKTKKQAVQRIQMHLQVMNRLQRNEKFLLKENG